MLLNITQRNDTIRISKINKEKKLKFLDIPIPQNEMFEWTVKKTKGAVEDDKFSCWDDGIEVYKKPTKFLNKFRKVEFISSLSQTVQDRIYEYNEPYKVFCDIETEIIDGFPDYNTPNEKITAIGFYYEETKTAIVYGIRDMVSEYKKEYDDTVYPNNTKKPKFISPIKKIQNKLIDYFKKFPEMDGLIFDYVYFDNEAEMLFHVFNNVIKKIDVLTGWYFIGFDWNYMKGRALKLGINPAICSFDGKLNYPNDTPQHKMIFDYQEIIMKWGEIKKKVENYKLNTVADYLLGVDKIKYSGTLQDLYESDLERYMYYNIVDVILVHLIDRKIRTFNVMLEIAALGKIETHKAMSPLHFSEITYCRSFYKQNKILPLDYKKWEGENSIMKKWKKPKITGGWNMKPVPGLFKILVGTDFASLYPNIKRLFDISSETYMGYYENVKNEGMKKEAPVKNPNITSEMVEANRITPMGTLFRVSQTPSISKTLLNEYYSNRVAVKKKMEIIDPKLVLLKKELASRGSL